MERFVEMVEAKIIPVALLSLLLCSCGRTYTWEKFVMDGHRTGVTAPNAENETRALGRVNDSCYVAPNGKVWKPGSATYSTAADMIAVQPQMSRLKAVVAHSAREMNQKQPGGDLANWIVDHIMEDVAVTAGRKVDVGIINSGGIRVDMPSGDVILDDIVSMFPFRNHLCYVALAGTDLLEVFSKMAAGRVQPFGGARLVVEDGRIDTLLVGGAPVDPDKVYGLATIDFLLDGGDGLTLAKNAKELIITDKLVVDSMLPYVESYEKEGRLIESAPDGRFTLRRAE